MKWIETKIFFDAACRQDAQDLVSNVFYDLGLTGVVVETPQIEKTDGVLDDDYKTPDFHAITGYFAKNDTAKKKRIDLEQALAELQELNGIHCRVAYRDIDEEHWAESWKTFFQPEKISDTITVKPTWQEYVPADDEIIIEIDPGMAFGTGTHPTTALCIKMVEKYLKPDVSFLDVGTGSGILMVAAAKLGAGTVTGLDNDEVATEIASTNLLQNNIDKAHFRVITGSLNHVSECRFDLIVVNILSEVIVEMMPDLKKLLANDGIAIFSGIAEKNKDTVLKKMTELHFQTVEVASKESWVAVAGKLL